MHKDLYIVRATIEELQHKCGPSVINGLRLFELRIENAIQRENRDGSTPTTTAERNEAFHSFQQTLQSEGLDQLISWHTIELHATEAQAFDELGPGEKEQQYLVQVADQMRHQLQRDNAEDVMYVPLHATYLPYGEIRSGSDTPKRSRHSQLVDRMVKSSDPILVVRGLPGTGKSVAMRQVVRSIARRSLTSGHSKIPVFVPLGQLDSNVHEPNHLGTWTFAQISKYLANGSFASRAMLRSSRFVSQHLQRLLSSWT